MAKVLQPKKIGNKENEIEQIKEKYESYTRLKLSSIFELYATSPKQNKASNKMLLSKLIPYERYELITKLTSVEVAKLISMILPSQQNPEALYEGEIIGDTFKVTRIIKYRNSFSPIIKGKISTVLNRTEISITMKPPVFTIVFLLVWIGITGIGCLKVIFPSFFNLSNDDRPIWFLPFFMLLCGYLLAVLSFKSESRKSKKNLETLLEA